MTTELDDLAALRRKVRLARMGALSSWVLLYLLLTAMSFLATPEENNAITIWLFQTIPLLCFLPGLIRASPRTHVWLSFLSMLYFVQGVMTSLQPAYLYWGIAETILSIDLFAGAVLYARWATDLEKATSGLSKE